MLAGHSTPLYHVEHGHPQRVMSSTPSFEGMVSTSAPMRHVFSLIDKVAQANSVALITGETGSGKDLIARAIHNRSTRSAGPLIKLNCAALPTELIESELFGHEKGAFTSALTLRTGRFELAHGGTLFLDEVSELPLPAQAKLLRAIQDQEFERVGGSSTIHVDIRLIAATNRNLSEMVRLGTFRSDLYYRLAVFPIDVPPLCERKSDIELLVAHFLGDLSRRLGKPLNGVTPESMRALMRYHWPGNIRELQNVLERAAIVAQDSIIEINDPLIESPVSEGSSTVWYTLAEVERAHILCILRRTKWVIEGERGAAALLALHPSTLRFRMQKLGIKRPGLADS